MTAASERHGLGSCQEVQQVAAATRKQAFGSHMAFEAAFRTLTMVHLVLVHQTAQASRHQTHSPRRSLVLRRDLVSDLLVEPTYDLVLHAQVQAFEQVYDHHTVSCRLDHLNQSFLIREYVWTICCKRPGGGVSNQSVPDFEGIT